MNKTEQVSIELPPLPRNPPPKVCPVRNQRPISHKFNFKPKRVPFLSKFVKQVSWDCHNKTIDLLIEETPDFDAYMWFEGINKRLAEAQKSAFVDLEEDSVYLSMYDKSETEVCTLKFRGLQLKSHFCDLQSYSIHDQFGDTDDDNYLRHSVTLNYGDCEIVKSKERFPNGCLTSPEADNVLTDYEWQAVSTY